MRTLPKNNNCNNNDHFSVKMEDFDYFSCANSELSKVNITEGVWSLGINDTHHAEILVEAILETMFVIVGIPWNSIVLITILLEKLYREPTYILLLNLVVADILVYVCVLPFNIYSAFAREFAIGNSDFERCGICQAIIVAILTLVYISLFILALMSIDRFIYIKWPLHYHKYVTIQRIIASLVVVYILCICMAILPIFGIGEIKFSTVVSSCSLITRGQGKVIKNNQFVIILVIFCIFPFCTTFVCNIMIMVIIYKTSHGKFHRKVEDNNTSAKDITARRNTERQLRVEFHRQQLNLVKLFGALFVVNIVTWVPTIVIAVISAIIGHEKIPNSLSILQYLAYVSQPVLHPMLETCLFTRARTEVTKYLCCFCVKGSQRLKATSPEIGNNYSLAAGVKRGSDSSTTSMTSLKAKSQHIFGASSLNADSGVFTSEEKDCNNTL